MGAMWHPGTRMLAESYKGNKETHHGGYDYFLLFALVFTRQPIHALGVPGCTHSTQTQLTRCVSCVCVKDEIEIAKKYFGMKEIVTDHQGPN